MHPFFFSTHDHESNIPDASNIPINLNPIPMPTLPKTGPALFLGIELAADQLRASIVDEGLDLVGVEHVDFDSELPEYQCVFLRVGAYHSLF